MRYPFVAPCALFGWLWIAAQPARADAVADTLDPPLAALPQPQMAIALRPQGPWRKLKAPRQQLVVVAAPQATTEAEAALRFKTQETTAGGKVEFLLYVKTRDLKTVVTDDARWLFPAGSTDPAGARFAPWVGVVVERTGPSAPTPPISPSTPTSAKPATPVSSSASPPQPSPNQRVRLRHTWPTGEFSVWGDFPTDAVGKHFIANKFRDTPEFIADVLLPSRFTLWAKPDGPRFAEYRETHRVAAQRVRTDGNFTLVRLGQELYGWIATRQVRALPTDYRALGGLGYVAGNIGSGGPLRVAPDQLPPNTTLFDLPNGQPVGRTVDTYKKVATSCTVGWSQYEFVSRLGTLTAWVPLRTEREWARCPARDQAVLRAAKPNP